MRTRLKRSSVGAGTAEKMDKGQKRHPGWKIDPAKKILRLANDHPAIVEHRTLFRNRVVSATERPRVLVSGFNSRKIGKVVQKGRWIGMPIYTLTLEERATCPKSCHMFHECYGNSTQWAWRIKPGKELHQRLMVEAAQLALKHPQGFVVRLHVLGDFHTTAYAWHWAKMMQQLPQLHVYGYTARPRTSPIGWIIKTMNGSFPDRCVIRFSEREPRAMGAVVREMREHFVEGGWIDERAFVCPVDTDSSACCANCGLCWSQHTTDKAVVFLKHGPRARKE